MSNPAVNVYAPEAVFAGESTDIEIEVDAKDEVRVNGIDAFLRCRRGWNLGADWTGATHMYELVEPDQRTRLVGPTTLAPGVRRYPIAIALPPDVPPSHDHGIASSVLEITVSVDSRWRTRETCFTVPVRRRPQLPVERTPIVLRNGQLELELASTRLVAGETLAGTLRWYAGIELAFLPMIRIKGSGPDIERIGAGFTRFIAPGEVRVLLPADMTPTFASATHDLTWRLVARAGTQTAATPLDIVDASASATTRRLAAAPSHADEALAEMLGRIAGEHGWRIGDERTGGVMIGPDANATVASSYRTTGTVLVIRFTYPPLGLGLDGEPRTQPFAGGVGTGIAMWDREYVVRARDDLQAQDLIAMTAGLLHDNPQLGVLARWTDRELVLERTTFSLVDLPAIASALGPVAATLAAVRAKLAPPIAADLEAWQVLARWLDAPLAVGDLSIAGSAGGVPVSVVLRFDGARPVAHDVVVGARGDDDLELHVPRPARDAASGGPFADLLAQWPTDVTDLRFANGVASASLPPKGDAVRVRSLIDALRALLAARTADVGPYR